MAPGVTVIIATYDWSAALAVAIRSVLAQTYRDFELLVVGDCCGDDSAEVVRSFADPRVTWHNLPVRHGSQSGPNNHGIGLASGRWIAYLGHDDVWHPDHLRSLVATMEETAADIAGSVCIMYGPPGSGVRFVSGVFIGGRYGRRDFLPPSSVMHRRDLTARIGPWGRPEELRIPVDNDLLRRAFDAGARIVSTGRLTTFKFNSAWRRDSYLRRDTTEQREMLRRLESDPATCVEQEWSRLERARREHLLFDPMIADEADFPPGHHHRHNLRTRGLESAPLEDLTAARRFTLEDQVSALDWHAVEHGEGVGSYRWTGPAPCAVVVLPIRASAALRIRLQLLDWLGVDVASEIRLRVAGSPVPFTVGAADGLAVRLEADVCLQDQPAGPLRIEIESSQLRCPHLETNGRSPDTRWLGVCVNWVEVESRDAKGACAHPLAANAHSEARHARQPG